MALGILMIGLAIFLIVKTGCCKKKKGEGDLDSKEKGKSKWKKINGFEMDGFRKC